MKYFIRRLELSFYHLTLKKYYLSLYTFFKYRNPGIGDRRKQPESRDGGIRDPAIAIKASCMCPVEYFQRSFHQTQSTQRKHIDTASILVFKPLCRLRHNEYIPFATL